MGTEVALAIAVVLGASVDGDAALRVEGTSRTNDTVGLERATVAQVAVLPIVAARVAGPPGHLRLWYAPTLRSADVLTDVQPAVIHALGLETRLRLSPNWSLDTVVIGSRGTTDLLDDTRRTLTAGTEPQAPRTIPENAARIAYAAASAEATLRGAPDPRTSLALVAGAFAGGGDDALARSALPVEKGFRARSTLERSTTRRDSIGVEATAMAAWYSTGAEGAIGTLTAGWRHRVSPSIEGRVRAGATAFWDDALAYARPRSVAPAGEVGLAHASERLRTSEELVVRATSSLDRVLGTADRETDADLSARWRPAPEWSFVVRAVAALVFQEAGNTRRGTFDVRTEWVPSRHAVVGLGIYGLWQESPEPVLPSFTEVGAFATLALEGHGADPAAGRAAGRAPAGAGTAR